MAEVEITIGDPPQDFNALWQTDADSLSSVWADYTANSRYEKDRGLYMLGVGSPQGFQGNSVSFVQLHAPVLLWIVDWTVSRQGAMPGIPDPASPGGNWVLLDDHYELADIALGPDGVSVLYRISGTYVYGCLRPSARTTDDVVYPRPPWLQDVVPRLVTPDRLLQGIFTANQGSGSGPTQGVTQGTTQGQGSLTGWISQG